MGSYEYLDIYPLGERGDSTITSYIDASNNDRLSYLSREEELTVPTNTEIVNLISSSDVIHRWTIPNLIVKVDAIPGRVNVRSFNCGNMERLKKIYGQCSELCGVNHRFIPISISVR